MKLKVFPREIPADRSKMTHFLVVGLSYKECVACLRRMIAGKTFARGWYTHAKTPSKEFGHLYRSEILVENLQ